MQRYLISSLFVVVFLAGPAITEAQAQGPVDQIRLWYRQYLGRDVDADGLQHWLGHLRAGRSLRDIQAGILGSDEYYRNAGGTPEGFVFMLFRDLTGRSPTWRDVEYWSSEVFAHGKAEVAYELVHRYAFRR